ncbi:YcgJ family protein [Klebsiella electrica]
MKPYLFLWLLATAAIPAYAKQPVALHSPEAHVLCDKYICATAMDGVSHAMTEKYLGKEAAKRLSSQGKFDPTSFTFADGTLCDIKEKLCREDRYYGADGKHSGAIAKKYTRLLFGK